MGEEALRERLFGVAQLALLSATSGLGLSLAWTKAWGFLGGCKVGGQPEASSVGLAIRTE